MFTTIAGLTTKVMVGAAAVALTGAGAVATISAIAPASASNATGGSSAAQSSSPSTPDTTPNATPEATNEPDDDNGVDATTSPIPSQNDVAVTRDQAIAIAQARFPQGALHKVELESEDGAVVWKIDLRAADGSRAKMWVDASTGTIVRERFKDAKNATPRPSASPRDDHANPGRDSDDHANSGRDDRGRGGDDNPSASDRSGQDDNGSNSGRGGSDD